jgi:hypothetical protein
VGILANDQNLSGDPMSAILLSKPGRGTVALEEDGSFVFTPKKNFVGTTSFTYKASDGDGVSTTEKVTIVVTKPPKVQKTKGTDDDTRESHDNGPVALGMDATALSRDHRDMPADFSSWQQQLAPQSDAIELLLARFANTESPPVEFSLPADVATELTGLPDFLDGFYSEFNLSI